MKSNGTKEDGTPITDEMIEEMADEAERGYDVKSIRGRQGGRPSMGSAPSSVESVRLDPELKRDLLLRASEDGVSVSETIREALRQYVQAG
jgi:predicted HicB family RNase H-like nuclease